MPSCSDGQVLASSSSADPASHDGQCDGVDDDCDGAVDEEYAIQATSCGIGACAATGVTSCVGGQVIDDCTPGNPASDDASCNSIDDYCGGAVGEEYISVSTACGVGACAATGITSCVSGQVADSCSPGLPAYTDASCNGIDDDCDGRLDEDGDADHDGVADCSDNCKVVFNPDQADANGNGIGNACESVIGEMVQVKNLMPILMRRRNKQQWTKEELPEIRAHLKRLSKLSPYLVVIVMPGGFAMLPVLAWWLDRRPARRGITANTA